MLNPNKVSATLTVDDTYTDWLDLPIHAAQKFMVVIEATVSAVFQPTIQFRKDSSSLVIDLDPALEANKSSVVFGEIIGTGQIRCGFKATDWSVGSANIEIRR